MTRVKLALLTLYGVAIMILFSPVVLVGFLAGLTWGALLLGWNCSDEFGTWYQDTGNELARKLRK